MSQVKVTAGRRCGEGIHVDAGSIFWFQNWRTKESKFVYNIGKCA